jgi:hypothetical protein
VLWNEIPWDDAVRFTGLQSKLSGVVAVPNFCRSIDAGFEFRSREFSVPPVEVDLDAAQSDRLDFPHSLARSWLRSNLSFHIAH